MKGDEPKKREFQALTGVSRETIARLEDYADLLRRWQRRINLVGDSTIDHIWERHFLDCGQISRFIEPGLSIADIGSGAGFPGLVLAIMGRGPVSLVERDQRKCVFLLEAARITGALVKVHCVDARNAEIGRYDVITARACASLQNLLEISRILAKPTTYCVFPKGANYEEELTVAVKSWKMDIEAYDSLTSSSGIVLVLRNLVYGRSNEPRI